MQHLVSEEIKNDKELLPQVERANELLADVIQSVIAPTVTANWDLQSDTLWTGQHVIALTLADDTGARAETKIPLRDLRDDSRIYPRFYKVWGDLLQRRSHKQLNHLLGQVDGQ